MTQVSEKKTLLAQQVNITLFVWRKAEWKRTRIYCKAHRNSKKKLQTITDTAAFLTECFAKNSRKCKKGYQEAYDSFEVGI